MQKVPLRIHSEQFLCHVINSDLLKFIFVIKKFGSFVKIYEKKRIFVCFKKLRIKYLNEEINMHYSKAQANCGSGYTSAKWNKIRCHEHGLSPLKLKAHTAV